MSNANIKFRSLTKKKKLRGEQYTSHMKMQTKIKSHSNINNKKKEIK